MERVLSVIKRYSSQTDASRQYIKSIDKIISTVFKLEVELNEEEQLIFEVFEFLNRIYIDFRNDPDKAIELIQDSPLKTETIDFTKDNNQIFNQLLAIFSDPNIPDVFFSINENNQNITMSINDYTKRGNIKLYQDEMLRRIRQRQLLYETSLITISNSFESLMSELIAFLVIKDDSIKINDKQISFKKISELGGLEEAKAYLIEKTVEETMRGSQITWLETIAKNTETAFYKELVDEEEKKFKEFFLRRNIIIHNDSKVNNKYLNGISPKMEESEKESMMEKKLISNEEYLLEHLHIIYVIGIKSTYYLLKSFYSDKFEETFSIYMDLAYKNLENEENEIAYEIYSMLWKDNRKLDGANRMLLSINYLQSLKWTGREKDFNQLISKEDYSLATSDHNMCLAIMKDDYEEALKYLKLNIANELNESDKKELDIINFYLDWPIFKEFKESRTLNGYLEEKGYKEVRITNELVDDSSLLCNNKNKVTIKYKSQIKSVKAKYKYRNRVESNKFYQ